MKRGRASAFCAGFCFWPCACLLAWFVAREMKKDAEPCYTPATPRNEARWSEQAKRARSAAPRLRLVNTEPNWGAGYDLREPL